MGVQQEPPEKAIANPSPPGSSEMPEGFRASCRSVAARVVRETAQCGGEYRSPRSTDRERPEAAGLKQTAHGLPGVIGFHGSTRPMCDRSRLIPRACAGDSQPGDECARAATFAAEMPKAHALEVICRPYLLSARTVEARSARHTPRRRRRAASAPSPRHRPAPDLRRTGRNQQHPSPPRAPESAGRLRCH